jgi:hypothetical protein
MPGQHNRAPIVIVGDGNAAATLREERFDGDVVLVGRGQGIPLRTPAES